MKKVFFNNPAMNKKTNSLYRALGLDSGVGIERVKSRYRAIAFRFHPDRAPAEKKGRQIFERATEAYKSLLNIEKKHAINKSLWNSVQKYKFEQAAYIHIKRNNRKKYFNRRTVCDIEYNQFIDEGRDNFNRFLEKLENIKS